MPTQNARAVGFAPGGGPSFGRLAVACALVVACAAARAEGSPATTTGGAVPVRVIRVGVEEHYAPFLFLGRDGQPAGIAVEYLRTLERELGVRFDLSTHGDLSQLLEMARKGEVDLLPAVTWTDERSRFLRFTAPYFSVPAVIVARRGYTGPRTIDGMTGLQVAVGSGYGVEEFLRRRNPGLILEGANNDETCLRRVATGGVAAAVVDLASASWIISSTGLQGLEVLGDVGFTYDLSMATRLDDAALEVELERGLRAVPSGDAKRIRDEWVRLAPAPGALARTVVYAVLAVIGLGLMVFGAVRGVNWALRAKVAERTRELARSELLHRTVAHHFPRGVVGLFDRDMRLVLADGAAPVTREDPRSLVGLRPVDFTPPAQLERVEELFRDALAGRERKVEFRSGPRVVEMSAFPVRDDRGEVVMGMVMTQDLTEQEQLQSQLEVTRRLAAIGTLVAGIGHEVNNPLVASLAAAGFAAEEVARIRKALGEGGPIDPVALDRRLGEVGEALADAQAGSQRVATVVRDFAAFAKPERSRSRVRLAEVVDSALRWLVRSVGANADVRVEQVEAPEVLASIGQLQQVVVNLVTNAAKAIPAGRRGTITVRTGPGQAGFTRLEVSDDGVGMSPDVLAHAFDPFFTTRKAAGGAGLGLAIAHAIITAQGGSIAATSEPGRGTTFRVELPVAGDEA